ncbi:aspartyl protease family protein [Aequorivita xiaoshiensis]|uniref:Aspartyl protease family protein n=1 Tax=Aequorivita xiaoshiensis TaxID=2874476 RepID=A0A9X1R426_9FLAO|nr:aspartyl protease family protein [Aequorivita xiaoshiensis]MCG2431861.1 aspartyl protease family protein [Aequorivita xiaoshiensis]
MNKLFAALFILFTTLNYAQVKTDKKIEIPFTQTSNGHIIISASINGIQGSFIFDTGAGINLLTKKFADKVTDLEKTHHFYTGHRATGEEIQSDLWNSKNLKIGDFKINKEIFAVYDIDFPLDGLISLTPFKDKPITIDFENKILSIETERSMNQSMADKDFEMPIQINNDRDIRIGIATTIKLNDTLTLNVSLDSGAGFNVFRFSSRFMENLGVDKESIESEYKQSMFKPENGNQYYYTTLSKMTDINNNVSVRDFKVTFIDGLIYEGILGINWIGKKITIDIPNKRLIVRK